MVHGLRLSGIVEEFYDAVVLHRIRRPMTLAFKSDKIRRVINVGDSR